MSEMISKYTDIIHIQSRLLMDSNKSYMPMAQCQAIELINRYSIQLAATAKQANVGEEYYESVRHELINILTPIVGYVEMLTDGWIGILNPNQVSHVEIIHQSVNALRREILAHRMKQTQLSESA